jgi:hypothetical protein
MQTASRVAKPARGAAGRNFKTKEVVGGFWIIQVKSREEALEWASRIPGSDDEMVVEVRRLFDLTDFDPETQKEIQKKFGDAAAAEMSQ